MTSRRLLGLLCTAVLGLLLAVGLVVGAVAGTVGALVYAAFAVGVVVLGAVRGRRLLAPAEPATDGRTCTCCTTSQLDPAVVVDAP